jgi:hypothetical protein
MLRIIKEDRVSGFSILLLFAINITIIYTGYFSGFSNETLILIIVGNIALLFLVHHLYLTSFKKYQKRLKNIDDFIDYYCNRRADGIRLNKQAFMAYSLKDQEIFINRFTDVNARINNIKSKVSYKKVDNEITNINQCLAKLESLSNYILDNPKSFIDAYGLMCKKLLLVEDIVEDIDEIRPHSKLEQRDLMLDRMRQINNNIIQEIEEYCNIISIERFQKYK